LKWPLYLHGPAGTGKTCAVLAFADRVPYSTYWTAEETVEWILGHAESMWRNAGGAPLLIVDELGVRSTSGDLQYQAVKRLADLRAQGRATIWVSNHVPEAIKKLYDDRIYSRICCGTWFELAGNDRRFQ
jgi:DNA replication protein DnaC